MRFRFYNNRWLDPHTNSYSHANSDCDGDGDTNCDCDANCDWDGDGDTNCDTDGDCGTEKHTDAQAAPDTRASLTDDGGQMESGQISTFDILLISLHR